MCGKSIRRNITIASILLGLAFAIPSGCNRHRSDRVTGGPCTYARYPGTITVKKIERDEAEPANRPADPEAQPVIVTVDFTADANSGAIAPAAHMSRTIEITKVEAEAKGIKAGKEFRAYSTYQTKGTCNPGPYLAALTEWQ